MVVTWNEIDRMFGAMNLLKNRLDRLSYDFDRKYESGLGLYGDSFPKTNLYDNGEHFEINAEVPGLSKDDIKLKIQGNYLEISGTQKKDVPEGYTIQREEIGSASFSRSFTIPSDVDGDKVEATLKNGILKLILPKSEAAKPKQISIN